MVLKSGGMRDNEGYHLFLNGTGELGTMVPLFKGDNDKGL